MTSWVQQKILLRLNQIRKTVSNIPSLKKGVRGIPSLILGAEIGGHGFVMESSI
jgi:hypothetical protein